MDAEWYWCASCEADDCDCGSGFYSDDETVEPECPHCGDLDVAP